MAQPGDQGDTPHYVGHRDRMRARFREDGGDGFQDYELLELVLFRSIPRRDVKPLAKDGYAATTHAYGKAGHYLVNVARSNDEGLRATAHLQVRVGMD